MPKKRQVRDVMKLDVVSVVPEMTVRELVQLLDERSISGAPVVDSMGKTVGVVSASDVLRFAIERRSAAAPPAAAWAEAAPALAGSDPVGALRSVAAAAPGCPVGDTLDSFLVADLMTPILFTIRPDQPLGDAVRMIRQGRLNRVLVMEDGVLHGIITPFDVLEALDFA